MAATWVDLLDPTLEDLQTRSPVALKEPALALLLAPPVHGAEPRPTFQSHGPYAFGLILVPRAVPEEDCIYYQEIGFALNADVLLTVRKTPPDERPPYDLEPIRTAKTGSETPGKIVFHIVDDVAEAYLDLVDDIDAEIDELEDRVDHQSPVATRTRISELRHDLLHVRRTLSPLRDAVRRVVDNVIEVDDEKKVFPHDVEIALNATYDKLLRALDGLELARDLLAGVRDYHQSKIANDQNEVTKRLTVVASLILVPTFIVGVYGQNFIRIPELHWHFGYAWSWALILASTLVQVWWFRRKEWL